MFIVFNYACECCSPHRVVVLCAVDRARVGGEEAEEMAEEGKKFRHRNANQSG